MSEEGQEGEKKNQNGKNRNRGAEKKRGTGPDVTKEGIGMKGKGK